MTKAKGNCLHYDEESRAVQQPALRTLTSDWRALVEADIGRYKRVTGDALLFGGPKYVGSHESGCGARRLHPAADPCNKAPPCLDRGPDLPMRQWA
jgi:hypothetical protein